MTKTPAIGPVWFEETSYTERGQVATITRPEGVLAYTYDIQGRVLTTTATPDGGAASTTTYGYNPTGELVSVSATGVGSTTYEYDAWGRLSQTVNANGTTKTRGYDGLGRLTSLKTFAPNNTRATLADNPVLSSFQNAYRADGKRTSTSETIGNLSNFTLWTYDELGRLTAERLDSSDNELDRETAWTFDVVGNRLTEEVDLGLDGDVDEETSFTYDQNDRLLSEAITFTTGPVIEVETAAYTY